jgi:glycosyltransferase involved in cell wall biosynthesis
MISRMLGATAGGSWDLATHLKTSPPTFLDGNMPIRVALSALSVKPGETGGGETVLRHLARHLPEADPESEYLLYTSRSAASVFLDCNSRLNLRIVGWPNMRPAIRVLYELFALPRLLRRDRVDVFLAVNQVVPPRISCRSVSLVQNLLYYHFSEFYKPSVIGWGSWSSMFVRNVYYTYLNRLSVSRADRIVAVSETARRDVMAHSGLPEAAIDVVALAPSEDLDHSAQRNGSQSDDYGVPSPFFLCVGALTPYKNLDSAIRAVALLRDRGVAAGLLIVGWDVCGLSASLRRLIRSLQLDAAVRVAGAVPHNTLAGLYSASRGLLLLSSCEAFPLPAVEAMCCGAPVIGSNLSSVPEVIGDGGITVDPFELQGLADVMMRLVKEDDFYRDVSERGRTWVRNYSWSRTASGLVAALHKATA